MTTLLLTLAKRIAEAQAARQVENERLDTAFAAACQSAQKEREQSSDTPHDQMESESAYGSPTPVNAR